jgi:cyclic beta-1,2-glucan synthetase
VLDPVLALRRRVRIAPGETARVDFWLDVGEDREAVLARADQHRHLAAFDAAKSRAEKSADAELQKLGIDAA